MNTRNLIFAAIFSVLIVTVGLFRPSAAQNDITDCIQLFVNGDTAYESPACTEPTNTPEPTATDTPPTETPVPPTPTSEPSGPIEPYPDASPCEVHDNKTWHGLWNYDLGCHHDHTHGDDPHELDDILGTELYALMDGDGFGTPWQTISADGYFENDVKHAGYIWYVRRDMPCQGSEPCVDNLRLVVHQHTIHDASVRFHSATVEGTTSDGGYFLFGTHMDFGDLHAPEGVRVVDVEGNHCGSTANPGNHKQHAVQGGNRAPSNIWYGRSRTNSDVTVDRSCGFVQIGTSAQDPWIWTSQTEPFMGNYVCYPNERCRANATAFRLHLFGVRMDVPGFDFLYENGVANFEGWADRYGVPYPDGGNCSAPSIDCAPFVVLGLSQGQHYGAHSAYTEQFYQDHDIYFSGQTSNWSQPVH